MTVEGYVRGTAVIAEGKMSMIINASGTVQVVCTYVDEPRSLRGPWTQTTPSGQSRAFAVSVPMASKVVAN